MTLTEKSFMTIPAPAASPIPWLHLVFLHSRTFLFVVLDIYLLLICIFHYSVHSFRSLLLIFALLYPSAYHNNIYRVRRWVGGC